MDKDIESYSLSVGAHQSRFALLQRAGTIRRLETEDPPSMNVSVVGTIGVPGGTLLLTGSHVLMAPFTWTCNYCSTDPVTSRDQEYIESTMHYELVRRTV